MYSAKRGLLSVIARIFNPLGFLAPTTFYTKTLMQRLWIAEISWDAPLPEDIAKEWDRFVGSLSFIATIRVPRYIGIAPGNTYMLCGFSDASEKDYAAKAYLRISDSSSESHLYLLGTETKLAPIKPSTIPRLELCGAVILAQWFSRLERILAAWLDTSQVYAWSDSTIVLSWLNSPHTSFKQFVSNRINQIHQLLPDAHWAYVKSADNPADCVSRGVKPSELHGHKLYWFGPIFLKGPIHEWKLKSTLVPADQLPEV